MEPVSSHTIQPPDQVAFTLSGSLGHPATPRPRTIHVRRAATTTAAPPATHADRSAAPRELTSPTRRIVRVTRRVPSTQTARQSQATPRVVRVRKAHRGGPAADFLSMAGLAVANESGVHAVTERPAGADAGQRAARVVEKVRAVQSANGSAVRVAPPEEFATVSDAKLDTGVYAQKVEDLPVQDRTNGVREVLAASLGAMVSGVGVAAPREVKAPVEVVEKHQPVEDEKSSEFKLFGVDFKPVVKATEFTLVSSATAVASYSAVLAVSAVISFAQHIAF
mmetsp:Transcript_35555/g.86979  ORF Transcript_35555/g.86979 Transcript_35555/m.86979 type:complete len:280 (-) Transcript_35555:96-935(-)